MHRPTLRRQALGLGLLLTLVVLALSACGGGGSEERAKAPQEAKARPLPRLEIISMMRPGEYHSVKFKPSFSIKIGKGWANSETQTADYVELAKGEERERWVRFVNFQKVYKPTAKGTLSGKSTMKVPKDLVGWFQQHPYLKISKPEPVTVGGVKGEQFDVVVDDVPKDYLGQCTTDCLDCEGACVDICPVSSDPQALSFREGWKRRVTVLEDVKGETVTIDFGSSSTEANDFHDFLPEAQKVVNSVNWEGS
jgi:ferredoxin